MASKSTAKTSDQKESNVSKEQSLALVFPNNVQLDTVADMHYFDIPFNARPIGGDEEEDEIKIRIPKMKLINAGSREMKKLTRVEGVEVGQYFNPLTNLVYDDLEVVVLKKFKERYFMSPPGSSVAACSSRDGLGKYGLCFSGEYNKHGIPTAMVRQQGVEMQVGMCKQCPKGFRAMGKTSECQLVEHFICTHLSFLENNQNIIQRIIAQDFTVVSEIMQNIFTLPFKASSMKYADIILQTVAATNCYFSQSWKFTSFSDSSDAYEWEAYRINSGRPLTDNEKTLAFTLNKYATKLHPIVTDLEVVQGTEMQPQVTLGEDVKVNIEG